MRTNVLKFLAILSCLAEVACSGSKAGVADPGAENVTNIVQGDPISAEERRADFERAKVEGATQEIEVGSGAEVATENTLKSLNLSPGVFPKGVSISFSAKDPLPQQNLSSIRFVIPYRDSISDKMVVLFRLPPNGNQPETFGLIPLAELGVDEGNRTVSFVPRGLGEYQMAELAVKVTEAIPKPGAATEVSVKVPTFQLDGMLSYTNFYGLENLGTHVGIIGDTGLRIIDVSVPAQPRQVGSITNANGEFGAGRAIKQSGNLVIQTTNQGGMGAFNVTDKTAPTFRGGVGDPSGRDLTIVGTYGFTASSAGLRTFTFANSINLGGSIAENGGCNAIDGDNQILVVACATRIIGYPTNNLPTLVGMTMDPAAGGNGVALGGGYAYVTGATGLRIFDVTTPSAPKLIASLPIAGALQVAVKDQIAVVLTNDAAVLVDVSVKASPKLFNPSVTLPITGGRRVKFFGTDKLIILDSASVKVTTIK